MDNPLSTDEIVAYSCEDWWEYLRANITKQELWHRIQDRGGRILYSEIRAARYENRAANMMIGQAVHKLPQPF